MTPEQSIGKSIEKTHQAIVEALFAIIDGINEERKKENQ